MLNSSIIQTVFRFKWLLITKRKFTAVNSTLSIHVSIILQNSTLKINYNGIKGLENTVRKCEGDIEFRGRA